VPRAVAAFASLPNHRRAADTARLARSVMRGGTINAPLVPS